MLCSTPTLLCSGNELVQMNRDDKSVLGMNYEVKEGWHYRNEDFFSLLQNSDTGPADEKKYKFIII